MHGGASIPSTRCAYVLSAIDTVASCEHGGVAGQNPKLSSLAGSVTVDDASGRCKSGSEDVLAYRKYASARVVQLYRCTTI